jgi:hypothetical protein
MIEQFFFRSERFSTGIAPIYVLSVGLHHGSLYVTVGRTIRVTPDLLGGFI